MVLLYTSPGCASCRKARQWLIDNHISFIEKNIFSNLLRYDEIRYLLLRSENGTEDIVSTRSRAFRQLGANIEDYSLHDLILLIQVNPSILKRPIMVTDKTLVVGYDEDEITAILPENVRTENNKKKNINKQKEIQLPTSTIDNLY